MEIIINIPVKELNEICAKPDRRFSTSTHYYLNNRDYVHNIFRYQKFKDDFADNIVCVNNNTGNFIGSFKPSYKEFIYSVLKALNIDPKAANLIDDELTKIMNDRLRILRNIPNEAELHNEFIVLYRNLQEGRKYIKEVTQEEQNIPAYKDVTDEDKRYFYSCGMRKGFDNYIDCQVEIYRRFIEQRLQYKEYIKNKNYNVFIRNNYDQDKLAMYLAHKYLKVCEDNINNKKYLLYYMKLLNKYVNSDYKKDISITVDGKRIDYDNILSRIKELKTRTDKMIVVQVKWPLIPGGEKTTYVKTAGDPQKHYLTQEELDELRRVGNEKDNFYLKNSPMLKIYGSVLKQYGILPEMSDYVAYVYPNGEILFDTEYDENRPHKVKGNAIYHMRSIFFDMVSGLDKQKLKRHPQVGTINHNETWTTRAQKLIDREATEEEKEQAKQFVKRIIEENEKDL